MDLGFKIHNKFDIEVLDAETKRLKQKITAYNVVCRNTFQNGYITTRNITVGIGGSETQLPSYDDIQLFRNPTSGNFRSNTTLYSWSNDLKNGLMTATYFITIQSTELNGQTLTEVGFAYTSGVNTYITTHALLRDQNGNPVSILKTDTDIINIYATVYIHYSENSGIKFYPGHMQAPFCTLMYYNNSVKLSLARYLHNVNLNHYDYYEEYNYGATTKGTGGTTSNWNYDSSQRLWTNKAERLLDNQGNYEGGIRHVVFGGSDAYDAILTVGDAWCPYSHVSTEAVGTGDGTTKDYSLKFAYPKNATITINGVATTEYTLDFAPPFKVWDGYVDFLGTQSTATYRPARDNTGKVILFNPAHAVGIKSFTVAAGDIYGTNSEDLDDETEWTLVGTAASNGVYTVPAGSTNYKYYKFNLGNETHCVVRGPDSYTGKNLHFTTPPAENAIITASYDCEVLAKDENSVVDFALTYSINEFN